MRKLPTDRRAGILASLVEGCSVNSTARMHRVSKVTVLRLLGDVGTFCADLHDRTVRGVRAEQIQADELWSFCGCKEGAKSRGAAGHGDVWTWVAIDRFSKLVIGYHIGHRTGLDAIHFMNDVASRVEGRPQVNTDALGAYRYAVSNAFDGNVDHAVIVKQYASKPAEAGARYSPPVCTGCEKRVVVGDPDLDMASTSHVERQNLSVRMGSRRYTRLTNGFSKRLENHAWAVHLHYWHYNFARKHKTLRTTPAVAAGLASRQMTTLDLIGMLEKVEAERGGRRITGYLAASAGSK